MHLFGSRLWSKWSVDPAIRGRGSRSRRAATGVAVLLLLGTGCTATEPPPPPVSSISPSAPRPFTVVTTDRVETTDPAAVTEQGSMIVVTNVFQRLLSSFPGQSEVAPGVVAYKPDLARDCSYTARTTFECVLNQGTTFSNGDSLTSTDVKFSIERAIRLDVAGSSASALSSLRRIETPDATTVRFLLTRYDRQFGWALASPAASVVDHAVYDSDDVQAEDAPIVGSGPFSVTRRDQDTLELARFDRYVGRTPAKLAALRVVTEPDSAAVEDAITTSKADLTWRGLSSAAQARLDAQVGASPAMGTDALTRVVAPGARVLQLRWNPASPHRRTADLRKAVASTLQEDRTSDSLVPPQVPGHRAAFPLGGKVNTSAELDHRVSLTLGYDPTIPDGPDLAAQLRSRIEGIGGVSVRLVAGGPDSDLLLEDRKAWTPTALAWLQPFLDSPLASSADTIQRAELQARTGETPIATNTALAVLQAQAGNDLSVLPLTQHDEKLYLRGAEMDPASFGPGWQLGLWGIQTQ